MRCHPLYRGLLSGVLLSGVRPGNHATSLVLRQLAHERYCPSNPPLWYRCNLPSSIPDSCLARIHRIDHLWQEFSGQLCVDGLPKTGISWERGKGASIASLSQTGKSPIRGMGRSPTALRGSQRARGPMRFSLRDGETSANVQKYGMGNVRLGRVVAAASRFRWWSL